MKIYHEIYHKIYHEVISINLEFIGDVILLALSSGTFHWYLISSSVVKSSLPYHGSAMSSSLCWHCLCNVRDFCAGMHTAMSLFCTGSSMISPCLFLDLQPGLGGC